MPKTLGLSALSLEKLTWASRYAAPLSPMPGPAVREGIRKEAGIPRHVMATIISASYTPFINSETGRTYRSNIKNSLPYARTLGYLCQLIADEYGQERLEEILNIDKEPHATD